MQNLQYQNESKYKEIKKAKGVKKSTVKEELKHEQYKKILNEASIQYSSFNSIRSLNHQLYSIKINKIGLSAYDSKENLYP